MRGYAVFRPTFWTGSTGKALRGHPRRQVLAAYLFSAPSSNMIGLYYLPRLIIAHETGLELAVVDEELVELARIDFAHYDPVLEVVWVVEGAAHQLGEELAASDKRIAAIWREAELYAKSPLYARWAERYGRGFRGSRKAHPGALKDPDPDPFPDPDPDLPLPGLEVTTDQAGGRARVRSAGVQARQVLAELSAARQEVMPGARPLRALPGNLREIQARLDEGASLEDCRHVIAVWREEVRTRPEVGRWFDAITPFRSENFARKLSAEPGAAAEPPRQRRRGDEDETPPSYSRSVTEQIREMEQRAAEEERRAAGKRHGK